MPMLWVNFPSPLPSTSPWDPSPLEASVDRLMMRLTRCTTARATWGLQLETANNPARNQPQGGHGRACTAGRMRSAGHGRS